MQKILILKFAFEPEKFPRNGAQGHERARGTGERISRRRKTKSRATIDLRGSLSQNF